MTASVAVHGAAGAAVVALGTLTASVVVTPRSESDLTFVRVAPPPPPVRVSVRLPPVVRQQARIVEAPLPEVKLPPVPEPVAERPEPAPPAPEPAPKAVVPEPPKPAPQVTVGAFTPSGNSLRAAEVARPVQPAGFDASAARAPEIQTAKAAVGAFEQAAGSGRPRPGTDRPNVVGDAGFGVGVATGRGRNGAGGVVSGGFGSASGGSGSGTRPAQAVRATDFDARDAPPAAPAVARAAQTEVPLEILSKPTPIYTEEARARRVEGDVLLEVEFAATGEIRVMRVVRGLGHGLDESATRAVQAMRFKPAQRNGQPIDIRTTVNIVFRLA